MSGVVGEIELPEPEDEFDRKVVADIREFGWHCIRVVDRVHPDGPEANASLGQKPVWYGAEVAYTVGLWVTRGHPELILVGDWVHAHAILTVAVGLIDEGIRLVAGDTSDRVLAEYPVRFGAVGEDQARELLTYADWANLGEPCPALQLILPDASGRWPDDPDYDSRRQQLLA